MMPEGQSNQLQRTRNYFKGSGLSLEKILNIEEKYFNYNKFEL